MLERAACFLLLSGLVVGCSGHPKRAAGPPPEYERPVVMPWDAGEPIDPLEHTEGEEVTDDEPTPLPASDAGLADAPRTLSPDGGEAE